MSLEDRENASFGKMVSRRFEGQHVSRVPNGEEASPPSYSVQKNPTATSLKPSVKEAFGTC